MALRDSGFLWVCGMCRVEIEEGWGCLGPSGEGYSLFSLLDFWGFDCRCKEIWIFRVFQVGVAFGEVGFQGVFSLF